MTLTGCLCCSSWGLSSESASETSLPDDKQVIYVFASDTPHGKNNRGSAREAKLKWGAIPGQVEGLSGTSYAIPSKVGSWYEKRVSVARLAESIERFKSFARDHPEMLFLFAGHWSGFGDYTPEEIAPLLHDAPDNVTIPDKFCAVIKFYRDLFLADIKRRNKCLS